MRRSLLFFLLVLIVVVTFLVHSVSTLISLLFENASADAILRSEIPDVDAPLTGGNEAIIPKIIHQTYINESIPEQWKAAQKSCLDLHPDYQYILWTDAKSEEFIAKEYPWFLDTFAGYQHPIQRADAIRYFVLAHYGGIYIDLDDGCKRRLDPLLTFPAWLRRTIPTGISNDAMGSVPQHPFFLRVIESLQGANRNWILPYITIMGSTGPLFLSVIWKKWINEHSDMDPATWGGRVRVLMPDEYKQQPWSFFVIYKGSSWHGGDAQFIFWLGRNWVWITLAGFALAGCIGFMVWMIYGRLLQMSTRRRSGSPPNVSIFRAPLRQRLPLWSRWTGRESGKHLYDLIEEHDA